MWRSIGIWAALITMGFGTVAEATSLTQVVEGLEQCQDYAETCLLIDVGDRNLSIFQNGSIIKTFKVAVGKPGWQTPIGNHYVFEMGRNVDWLNLYTGEPSSHNPMLGQWIGYARYDDDVRVGFHPTAQVNSVGEAASHGCNRMRPDEFNQLYTFISKAKTLVPVLVRQ
ncbi:MAG: L,D-transpeptidase [Thermosynechococcaceae cyanobacterium]